MENSRIADIFDEIADLLELQGGDAFRIRSYRNAARTVRDLPERLADLAADGRDLSELPHIGESSARKIHEILDTGTCRRVEELRKDVPPGLPELMRVPNLGPRKAMMLHEALGVTSIDDLRRAAEAHRVRTVAGFGARTEQKVLEGIQTLQSAAGRVLYRQADEYVHALARHLDGLDSVKRWVVAGSFRRGKETVGDLDLLVEPRDRAAAAEQILRFEDIDRVDLRGQEKVTVRLTGGLQVDFRFVEADAFGAAWLYFTGSKAHNISLRRIAQEHDWKLNEYGLFKGDNRLAGNDEESIYHRLNLAWVPPELREDRGEIDAAASDALPSLIELSDVRGDLQGHTTASDGTASIEEMAMAAKERGYEFYAITDHSKRVTMAGGLDDERCRRHAEAIREANERIPGLWLMAGIEVDILKTGKLDLKDKTLEQLDWVVASVHYDRNLSKKDMTDRLVRAVRSGLVHTIGHPLGRIIGQREPLDFDLDAVFSACAEAGVRMEVNGQPDRLDLPDTLCRQGRDAGVRFTLGTDAHKVQDLAFMRFGINVARRGWLRKGDVLNTLTVRQLRKELTRRA